MRASRRMFLRDSGLVAGAAIAGCFGAGAGCSGRTRRSSARDAGVHGGSTGIAGRPARDSGMTGGAAANSGAVFVADAEIALRAVQTQAQILPGMATAVWSVDGNVLQGPSDMLQASANGALGPTVHVQRGQKLRVRFENRLGEDTILHWHGLSVPAAMDGHPRSAVAPGQQYVYEFEVRNQAGTYLYHAHPNQRTGEQVYRGIAGLFIIHDAEEDALALPSGDYDVPLVIQDRMFDADNQLVYAPLTFHGVGGWLGDRVLVNGSPDFVLRASARAYRLRVANVSNSRIYRLAWQDGTPLNVIGTDGGLLAAPVQRDYVMLAPGERIELWADFSLRSLGAQLALVSQAFDAGAMDTTSSVAQGAPMTIMTVSIEQASSERLTLPSTLRPITRYRDTDAVNASAPRRIVVEMQHMTWTLNGRTFQLDEVADDERVRAGTLELWQFENTSGTTGSTVHGMHGGMGTAQMPHPIHVHTGQFQVLKRTGVTHAGYVDDGWKDTVLLMPGETATIAMAFETYQGVYVYHCHNLEHEDQGMMRNFAVTS